MQRIQLILLAVVFIFGCRENELGDIPFDPEKGWFPESPMNISEINTRFDEYDCNVQASGMNISMYYTTNFEKSGADLDLKGSTLQLNVDKVASTVEIKLSGNTSLHSNALLPLVNSSANDQGPLAINANFGSNWYFLYAHNKKGQYDLEYVYKEGSSQNIQGPFSANVLNSNVCDFYPAINSNQTEIIFSSYRGKKYDLYQIDIEGGDFVEWLNAGQNIPTINTSLSSNEDDKCPAINGNLLLFASDREGGYGGYDIWYSVFQNGAWASPVNFGPDINSEHNEFGPSAAYFSDSKNDLLFFSSNRPGGKGGYDFYFVGIPKMIK